jgi:uncharacterized protein
MASWTQTATEAPSQPYIEVNGMAEMQVVPDEIYIQFYIKEYEKDKSLQTIEMQEQTLTAALQSAGLQMQEINVSDFESNYVRVEWGKRDYRQEKKYDFKVRTLQETAKVFEVFEKLEITRANITHVDHSERKTYENDMRIAATKNAKTRANDMLQAIEQKAGKAIFVKEVNTAPVVGVNVDYYNNMKLATDVSTFKGGAIVQYQKITISASVFARFVIE